MRSLTRFLLCCLGPSFLLGQAAPNHLEPIPLPIWHFSLRAAQSALIPHARPLLWMLVAPSFEGEYSISLINTAKEFEPPTFILEYSTSSFQFSMPPPPPPLPGERKIHIPKFNPKKDIKFNKVHFPNKIAETVISVWGKVVKNTRYQTDSAFHIGCDGTGYYFYFDRWYYGFTWTPSTDIPESIVQLGESLIEYVKLSPASRLNQEHQIEKLCQSLQAKN